MFFFFSGGAAKRESHQLEQMMHHMKKSITFTPSGNHFFYLTMYGNSILKCMFKMKTK